MDQPAPQRHETVAERADRNWIDLLQEFRVMQTGVQILGGFLLTLPFQSAFADLDTYQRRVYLVLVLVAVSATMLLLAPVAVHRHLFGKRRKAVPVAIGHRAAQGALVLIAVLMIGIATFVFDIVIGRSAGLLVGVGMLAVAVGCLVVLPVLGGRSPGA